MPHTHRILNYWSHFINSSTQHFLQLFSKNCNSRCIILGMNYHGMKYMWYKLSLEYNILGWHISEMSSDEVFRMNFAEMCWRGIIYLDTKTTWICVLKINIYFKIIIISYRVWGNFFSLLTLIKQTYIDYSLIINSKRKKINLILLFILIFSFYYHTEFQLTYNFMLTWLFNSIKCCI